MSFELKIGNSAINAFKRLPYTPAYALAEFIDNSTQSFIQNRNRLDESHVHVSIVFDRNERSITIRDTAFGMSSEDLSRALTVGIPPQDPSGRSRYGMGMKTAACWFGSKWSITSKQKGSPTEFEYRVDVDKFSKSEDNASTYLEREKPAELHYTIIKIEDVSRQISGKKINDWRRYLGSIYRKDIEAGRLVLELEHEAAVSPGQSEEDFYLSEVTGKRYKVEFDEVVPGCNVHISGWIGCFARGKRELAGISVFQNDRCIMGGEDSWRPSEIFASGAGSTLNQRLVGEVNLDDSKIVVSHTKDAILWSDEQEESIANFIKNLAIEHDIIRIATRRWGQDDSEIQKRETAIAEFRELALNSDFIDKIAIVQAPNKDYTDNRNRYAMDVTRQMEPDFEINIARIDKKIYVKLLELSPNDPYYAYEVTSEGDLITLINTQHPGYVNALNSANPGSVYFLQCALDSFAEWRCRLLINELVPESIKEIKDQILKYHAEI